jgi:hypothetical protein
MDGGIMETALLGAAMGGGTSLITGGDPLKGALMGGLMGGIGNGIFGSGAMPGAEAATGLGAQAATSPGITSLLPETNMFNPAAASNFSLGAPAATPSLSMPPSASFNPMQAPPSIPAAAPMPVTGAPGTNFLDIPGANFNTNQALAGSTPRLGSGMAGDMGISNAPIDTSLPPLTPASSQPGLTSGAGTEGLGIKSLTPTPGTSTLYSAAAGKDSGFIQDLMKEWKALPASKKLLYGGVGAIGLSTFLGSKGAGFTPEPYTGPLSRFKYNPDTYRASNPSPYRFAGGGIADLGGYSDGGRMLKGPGDGMSDNIPATIAGKQPARLANEEFVVPADVVSHLGNGSSDAGAKQLYAMMHRVRKARTGNPKQGREINAGKYLPA